MHRKSLFLSHSAIGYGVDFNKLLEAKLDLTIAEKNTRLAKPHAELRNGVVRLVLGIR